MFQQGSFSATRCTDNGVIISLRVLISNIFPNRMASRSKSFGQHMEWVRTSFMSRGGINAQLDIYSFKFQVVRPLCTQALHIKYAVLIHHVVKVFFSKIRKHGL